MAGTAVFQSTTLATPGAGIVVHTDNIGGTVAQMVKIDIGPAGTSVLASYAAGTGLPVAGVGTFQALGTFQPLAGSVHVANTLPGTVQVLGSVQTVGTSQVLGTTQPLAGSVHIASTPPGTTQVIGTVQPHGTTQVLGSVQTVGTSQVLGSVQTVGTSQVLGTVRTLAATGGLGESMFGTLFTAGVTNGTLVPAPAAGTFVRVYDIIVSGSAAGTAFLEFGDGTAFGPGIFAANGGFVFNSSRGVRTRGTSYDILFNAASGSWGVSVNYVLEN